MAESGSRRKKLRQTLCCSFGIPPQSPDNLITTPSSHSHPNKTSFKSNNSIPNSPLRTRTTAALGFVGRRIDPRRILSPGRVSPIDSEGLPVVLREPHVAKGEVLEEEEIKNEVFCGGVYDVRLSLKGKNGVECLVLELDSEVLSASSRVFANLIEDCRRMNVEEGGGGGGGGLCRIEVPEVENLSVFHETIELMYEEDVMKRVLKMGVSRSIDVVEVAAGIRFTKGVFACFKYLEAVPWSEREEEKLKSLFTRFKFDDPTSRDVLARLYSPEQADSQHLAMQLVSSVTKGSSENSRHELKSLVKGLLSKSSVYEKDLAGFNKKGLYAICQSCLDMLVGLFEEATGSKPEERLAKPLIERISRQVDNINWIFELLVDQQMAEEFVDVWADQKDLRRMHESTSPMVRYELSRISAWIFIAMGRGKLRCRSEARFGVLQAWFTLMLTDFGWLQRCRKGLEIKMLEEAMGQVLLTLPVKCQQLLFMEWFRCFSTHGTECPNLSKAFEIWWRRSFSKGGETSR
ncbi:hypothetical protein GIB67_031908 [Kingdonia uniflora]|uniref:At3g05675-like ankyrin-like domain-containing protein n=1 Tax=Kingdonia uniflora TaxID=39325 RepID=A0A7J7NTX7_9MAGN|nr:hypothetical protein GIB67_031908 [Kingdonia uniflora]